MPLVKVQFRPGVNTELTNYANEGGWVNGDKIRFRSGYPEKLGGWVNYSPNYTFIGVARFLYCWVDYSNNNLLSIGTNSKFYVEDGGQYYDITPISYISNLTNPFSVVSGSYLVTVTDPAFNSNIGTWVTFSGVTNFTNPSLNGSFEIIAVLSSNTYQIIVGSTPGSSTIGGGAAVVATYQLNAGNAIYATGTGYGVGPYSMGGYGSASFIGIPLRLWSQFNYNQDLMMAYRGGPIYYWVNSVGAWNPAVTLNTYIPTQVKVTLAATFGVGSSTVTVPNSLQVDIGAVISGIGITPGTYVLPSYDGGLIVPISNTTTSPSSGNYTFSYSGMTAPNEVSQIVNATTFGFVIALGSTPYDPANFDPIFDPLLVRWSDEANAAEWTQTTYNQAGQQDLSNGSYIVGSINTRQEILIWTDTAIYSMQYIGPPFTFGFTVLMDNISVMSPNCMVSVGGITYWMGIDKFYVYSGMVTTLPCIEPFSPNIKPSSIITSPVICPSIRAKAGALRLPSIIHPSLTSVDMDCISSATLSFLKSAILVYLLFNDKKPIGFTALPFLRTS